MSSIHHWSIAVIAALALAAPASAQQGASAAARLAPTPSLPTAPTIAPTALDMPTLTPEPVTSPTSENAVLGLRASTTTVAPSMVPLPQQRQSENVAMMIVGGAGLVIGSLIDGDTGTIVMVAGGVVGLIGLFRYLR